jgi:hypothetical protein
MPVFAVSFRIKQETIAGKTYEDRYNSTVEAIKKVGRFWGDTTSFYLVNTAETERIFLERLRSECELDPKEDQLTVVAASIPEGVTGIGTIGPQDNRAIKAKLGLP